MDGSEEEMMVSGNSHANRRTQPARKEIADEIDHRLQGLENVTIEHRLTKGNKISRLDEDAAFDFE
jgi:hypothetical protein